MSEFETDWLDFVVIGTQKAGTTTLFQHLRQHPRLDLPKAKEVPFFSNDPVWRRGAENYVRTALPPRRAGHLRGTVTPQYLVDPYAPHRLSESIPNAKLITILRNPIERTASHFAMQVRWENEERDFESAITAQMEPGALDNARRSRSGAAGTTSCYLAWSEYGRLLRTYYDLFDARQLHVLFLEDLARAPRATLRSVYEFLGVETDFVPPDLGKTFHRGGLRRKFTRIEPLARSRPSRGIIRRLPKSLRRRLRLWWRTANVVPDDTGRLLTPPTRRKLAEFFADDVADLRLLTGLEPPWEDFSSEKHG